MITNLKKRLAIFLSILFVLPALVTILPMNSLEVAAATTVNISQNYNISEKKSMQVEVGQGFYFGDYVFIEEIGSSSYTFHYASELQASYTSSKKKVAAIDSNGYVETKKAGKTKITVTYKKQKVTCTLEVVPAGTLTEKNVAAINEVETAAEELSKKMIKKVTVANGYNALKALNAFDKVVNSENVVNVISSAGFLKEEVTDNGYTYFTATNKLAVPLAGRNLVLANILYDYGSKNNPIGTTKAKQLHISSVSSNTSAITVKTTKKVDDVQILAAHIGNRNKNTTVSKKKVTVGISLKDVTAGEYYTGFGELKKGSNVFKITPKKYYYKDGKAVYKAVKLVKGHTYEIGYYDDWAQAKRVTVK